MMNGEISCIINNMNSTLMWHLNMLFFSAYQWNPGKFVHQGKWQRVTVGGWGIVLIKEKKGKTNELLDIKIHVGMCVEESMPLLHER